MARAPACILTGIALVYHFAPAAHRSWHWVTPGSAFAASSWVLASLGLRFYVINFGDFNRTYGSIGGVILLVLWLYVTGVALLLGAEIDSEITTAQADRERNVAEVALAGARRGVLRSQSPPPARGG